MQGGSRDPHAKSSLRRSERINSLLHAPHRSEDVSSQSSTPEQALVLTPCHFGLDCFRRNPFHFAQYTHPPSHPFYTNLRLHQKQVARVRATSKKAKLSPPTQQLKEVLPRSIQTTVVLKDRTLDAIARQGSSTVQWQYSPSEQLPSLQAKAAQSESSERTAQQMRPPLARAPSAQSKAKDGARTEAGGKVSLRSKARRTGKLSMRELTSKRRKVRKGESEAEKCALREKLLKWRIPLSQLRVLCKIDGGAFGDVVQAEYTRAASSGDAQKKELVAMKMLHRLDKKAARMFRKEAALLCGLSHPNVVKFLGVCWRRGRKADNQLQSTTPESQTGLKNGENAGSLSDEESSRGSDEEGLESNEEEGGDLCCIVMEYMPTNLKRFVKEARKVWRARRTIPEQQTQGDTAWGGLPQRQVVQFGLDISLGLQYLHSRDPPILHRDLKPANILVCDAKKCKIADFGVSRENMDSTVMTTCGTPHYMSPEVLLHNQYSTKVDVYSLGMLLSELVTGQVPFSNVEGTTKRPLGPMQVMMKAAIERKRPSLPPSLHPLLKSMIEACWEHSAEARPNINQIVLQLMHCKKIMDAD